MRALFPKIKPYAIHKVNVGEPHILHVEESGSKTGLPILFLHGGPGGGCDENSARFFDPTIYRIITFDQRGCGQSSPYACLENNTTWDLVSDIEVIRKKLAINQWIVFGGSWGGNTCFSLCPDALGIRLRFDFTWYFFMSSQRDQMVLPRGCK